MTALHVTALHVTALATLLGVTLTVPGAGGALAAAGIWGLCMTIIVRSQPNGIVSLPSMYLLLLGVFHLGFVVPVSLGMTPGTPPSWTQSSHLKTALGLFSTAAVAFTLGTRLHAPRRVADRTPPFLRPQAQLFWMGSLVAIVGATLLWIGIVQLGILSAHYTAYYERALTEDVRFFGFGRMLFPIGLLIAAVGATPRQMFALGGAVLVILGPLFVQGFRGPFIVHGMALLAIWANKDPRLARRLAAGAFAAAIVLVPAVRMARNQDAALLQGVSAIEPLEFVLEAGGSLRPLVLTVEVLESGSEPFWMGRSYARAARRLIPNVSTHRRAGASRVDSLAPNAWATFQADPWLFERGGGIGFSGVAEPYLNFGVAGVVLVFLGLGAVLHAGNRWLRGDGCGPFRAALVVACFGFVLWTVRNDAMELGRAFSLAIVTTLAAWCLAELQNLRHRIGPKLDPAQARASRCSAEALE